MKHLLHHSNTKLVWCSDPHCTNIFNLCVKRPRFPSRTWKSVPAIQICFLFESFFLIFTRIPPLIYLFGGFTMANFYLVLIWHLGLERLQVARRTWYWCRGGSFRGPEDDTAIFLRLNPSPNFCKTLKLHHLLLKFNKSFLLLLQHDIPVQWGSE